MKYISSVPSCLRSSFHACLRSSLALSIVAGVAATTLCFFVYNQEYDCCALFFVSGALAVLFTRNMIVVFSVAFLVSNAVSIVRTRRAFKYWSFPGARSNTWVEGMTDGGAPETDKGPPPSPESKADPVPVPTPGEKSTSVPVDSTQVAPSAPAPPSAPPVAPTPVASNANELKLNAIQDRLDDIQASIYKIQRDEAAKEAALAT